MEQELGSASHDAVNLAIDLTSVYLELDQASRAEALVRRYLRVGELDSGDRSILQAELATALVAKREFENAEFLLHVLPRGFVRIRFFGFPANRRRKSLLALCQQLLRITRHPDSLDAVQPDSSYPAIWRCPRCGGPILLRERLTALQVGPSSAEWSNRIDSS